MTTVRTAEAHVASYPDAIAVAAGDSLVLTGQSEDWDGWRWLWARGPDGREGWVPDDLAGTGPDGVTRARRAFDAMELTVAAGETVTVLERTHGWVRLRNAEGAEGWAPERCLAAAAG